MNRPHTPSANGPGWAVRILLAPLLAGWAAAQTAEFRQTSVPVGIINQTTQVAVGSTASTISAPLASGSHTFCHWTLNAVRWADPVGTAYNPATFTVSGNMDAVAIYVPTDEDSDGDGLPDWWEYRHFGHLDHGPDDNPDGDAFTNAEELARGTRPNAHDEGMHGGVSHRRAPAWFILDSQRHVRISERSIPQGVIVRDSTVPRGVPFTLSVTPPATEGHRFTGWLLDGARYGPTTAAQPLTIAPMSDMLLTARYVREDEDADGDGLEDWKEWLWFESLQHTLDSDPDLDGFSNAEEDLLGLNMATHDELAPGGVSHRRFRSIHADTTGAMPLRLTSDPASILDEEHYHPGFSLVTVASREGHTAHGYRFSWWDLNGARVTDASGASQQGFSFILDRPSLATAHYIDPELDSDGDGIPDWMEYMYYGSLDYDGTVDSDGDGFDFATEIALGQSPRAVDLLAPGGVSHRRSAMLAGSTIGHLPVRYSSDPDSILVGLEHHTLGSRVTVADRGGHTQGPWRFAWWERNGAREEDASGAAQSGFTFTIGEATHLVAHYVESELDSDGDGIPDWYEWVNYGSLAHGAGSDTDGDGFSLAEEYALGQSARVADELMPGGVSHRRAVSFSIDPEVTPGPPEIGELLVTDIAPTSATLTARINPLSSATTASFEWGPTPEFGHTVASVAILNGFIADLMSAGLTGLAPDTLYYFRVIASNSNGSTVSDTASFRTTGMRVGYEDWAAVYSIGDPAGDEDGDGVPNLVEYGFGMQPHVADQWLLPQVSWLDGRMRLSVTPPADVRDVIYGAQYSRDLVDWHDLPDIGSGGRHEFLTPAELRGAPKLFVRWALRLADPD